MFEKLKTPEDIFSFKLGSAREMEQDALAALEELQGETNRAEIRDVLAAHAAETKRHVVNVEECFRLLGEEPDTSPNPVTKGLAAEAKASLEKTDASIVDAVILAGAIETEHLEIATYEVLIPNADARGAQDVKALLQHNLDDELRALDTAKELAVRFAHEGWAVQAA